MGVPRQSFSGICFRLLAVSVVQMDDEQETDRRFFVWMTGSTSLPITRLVVGEPQSTTRAQLSEPKNACACNISLLALHTGPASHCARSQPVYRVHTALERRADFLTGEKMGICCRSPT